MKTKNEKLMLWFSITLFLLSVSYLIINLQYPEYGGDEVWFATILLYKKISDLGIFEFIYAGPIKTILTYLIFDLFGFNIYTVRLFSIGIYIFTVLCWSIYLAKNKLWIALASSLIIFALNADLMFFAKVDINQPTFHNLFFVIHLIVFLSILKNGPKLVNSLTFILLAVVESNLHIRNIWIMNAFLLTYILDYIVFTNPKKISKKEIVSFLSKGWVIVTGWLLSVCYFLYVIIHFRNDPLLMQATAPGNETTYTQSISRSFFNLFDYIMGSRVFADAFSYHYQRQVISIFGASILITTIILFFFIYKRRSRLMNRNFFRITNAVLIITLLIFAQYAITKSSVQSWHGNHVLILWALIFGLLIEGLFIIKFNIVARVLLVAISVACIVIQFLTAIQSKSIDITRRGFHLVIWQPFSLTPIRQYIHNHPGDYVAVDWEIGRPLALENHYSFSSEQSVLEWLAPFKEGDIIDLSDKLVIRATSITQTVPDWSDETLAGFYVKFESKKDIKDQFGRVIYQIGYLKIDDSLPNQ